MQKMTSIEDFREGLDIEICATLDRDFTIDDIEITRVDGETVTKDFLAGFTKKENQEILIAIQEVEVYTGY